MVAVKPVIRHRIPMSLSPHSGNGPFPHHAETTPGRSMNVGRALSHYVGLQRSAPIVERRWERPALFLEDRLVSMEGSNRLIIHRAVHACAASRSWSPTDVVRISYSRNHKFFSAGHVLKRDRWGDHIISQFIEEVDTPDISHGLPQAFLDKIFNFR